MKNSDAELIWEAYDKVVSQYFYPTAEDGTEFEVRVDSQTTPFDVDENGQIYVYGHSLAGYTKTAPIGITLKELGLPSRMGPLAWRQREVLDAVLPYLNDVTPAETRRPDYQEQHSIRSNFYSSGTFKGE